MIISIVKNWFGIKQYPSFITYFVTWKCNCKCVMCDIWKKSNHNDELSIEEISRIFNQIKRVDSIRITGGEPFLRDDLSILINTIDKAISPRILHITTNGFLTDRIINTVQKIKSISKVHLKISIDDINEKHDEIRGLPKSFDHAYETIVQLAKLQKNMSFYLGVNQTIVNEHGIEAYYRLKEMFNKYNIQIHPVLAYTSKTGLYSDSAEVSPSNSINLFGNFAQDELESFLLTLQKDTWKYKTFSEKLVKLFYLKGLKNRLISYKQIPNPSCVALRSHLRILPNGDIPVCMYNPSVVGNLKKELFADIWFGNKIDAYLEWVKKCQGCWASCEVTVNAIYTGNIWKGLL